MEETLKTVRAVNLALIAVCAAIAIFAASPRKTDIYTHAKVELEALRELDLSDFANQVSSKVSAAIANLSWLQPHTLFGNGRIVASLSPFDLFPVRWGEPMISQLRAGAPLDEWFKFFDSAHPVAVFVPNEHDEGFQRFLRNIADFSQTSQPELQTLSFKPGVEGDPPSPMPAYAVCTAAGHPSAPVFTENIPAIETLISKDEFRPWLATANSAKRLRDISGTAPPSLDRLRTIRNEIGGLKISEAAQYLENRISSDNRKIDVLGVAVDEKLAVVAAPIAALLILLYWLLVIRHLKALLQTSVDEAKLFPWIGLFPGFLAGALVHGSAWLPLVVSAWLVWGSWTYASVALLVSALGTITLIGVAGFLISHQVSDLRRRMAEL
jgi:hypothetical protein